MNAWGILGNPSPEKVQEWMNMPYGKFKQMVADVNKKTKGKPLRKYTVEIRDETTNYKSAFVNVDAADSDQAIKLSQLIDKSTLNWGETKVDKYNTYVYRVSQVRD